MVECVLGGPFLSPYSQVLLAFALLSPIVAHSSQSIVFAYIATLFICLLFQTLIEMDVLFSRFPMPPVGWYVGTTLAVLLSFGALAALNRKYLESGQ